VLDWWLSATRDLPAGEAFFRRTIASTGCTSEHVVTDRATFYPRAVRSWAPDAKHTATGFYNRVISTHRCERNHGYLKSHPAGEYKQRDRLTQRVAAGQCQHLRPLIGEPALSNRRPLNTGLGRVSARQAQADCHPQQSGGNQKHANRVQTQGGSDRPPVGWWLLRCDRVRCVARPSKLPKL
jgi:hypothetical protein